MKALSNSEFAQMLAARFPVLSVYDHNVNVYDQNGEYAIHAKETKTGYSSVIINGKPYGKMTASEKCAAVEFVQNLSVEIVSEISSYDNKTIFRNYWVAGAYMWRLENVDRKQWWYESKKSRIVSIEKFI